MGVQQFFAWVEQAYREVQGQQVSEGSWRGNEHDAAWQAMRQKRDEVRGYELRPVG